MLHILAIIFGLLSSTSAMMDMSYLCINISNGEFVANPFDCQSYFVCNIIPKIKYCDEGLHFDEANKICNWPEFAKCKLEEEEVINNTASTNDGDIQLPERQSTFTAIDVETGTKTDPMYKYNPKHIECRHYGAYFLPHPIKCDQYFICAYGHLHQHHCGAGTLWNYKVGECQLASQAICYAKANSVIDTEEIISTTAVSSTTATLPTTTTPVNNPVTVCYIINGNDTPSSTSAIPGPSSAPTTTRPPTPTTTTEMSTTTATSRPLQSTTPRFDGNVVSCPANRQAYLAHATDCTKYFICVLGMPVLTSCPEGLYWNEQDEFCDAPKNVKCFQKKP